MAVCVIGYRLTRRASSAVAEGEVRFLRFEPFVFPRLAQRPMRIDRRAIGAVESTLLYTERTVDVAVRGIGLGRANAAFGASLADDWDDFFASAADGQLMTIDPTALPHHDSTLEMQLSIGDNQLLPQSMCADRFETRFTLIETRQR